MSEDRPADEAVAQDLSVPRANVPGKFTTELSVLKQPPSVPSLDLNDNQPAKKPNNARLLILLGCLALALVCFIASRMLPR